MKRKGIRLIHCKTDVERDQQRDDDHQTARVLGRKLGVETFDIASIVFGICAPIAGDLCVLLH